MRIVKRLITPDTAKSILSRTPVTAGSNGLQTFRLCKKMTSGSWDAENNEPVVFDEVGKLVDGVKRMRAVIWANKTIPMMVVGNHGLIEEKVSDTVQQQAGVQSGVEIITPEYAEYVLANHNKRNRRASVKHIERLAKEMQKGQWSLNGATIAFDDEGVLIDGQHRLAAVVLAGIPMRFIVVRGVSDPRAFLTIDTAMRLRSAGQISEMIGLKGNVNAVVAATRLTMAWDNSDFYEDFVKYMTSSTYRNFSSEDVSNRAVEIQDYVREPYIRFNDACRFSGSPSLMMALFYIFKKCDPEAAEALFTRLSDGVSVSRQDPVKLLRDALLRGKFPIRNKRLYIAALTIKAFNAISEGKEIRNLRWRTEGAHPEQFPKIKGSDKK